MSVAQLSKRGVWIAAAAGLVAVAIGSLRLIGPSYTPKSQPPLASLSPAGYADFQHEFDASSDETRLLVVLSPT